ncbi:MAG: hypothetical protein P1V51_19895 [Deltaproteobacteria bacterium]|nr:hypothetical protein [Deltaproteobacteria bacterium]
MATSPSVIQQRPNRQTRRAVGAEYRKLLTAARRSGVDVKDPKELQKIVKQAWGNLTR